MTRLAWRQQHRLRLEHLLRAGHPPSASLEGGYRQADDAALLGWAMRRLGSRQRAVLVLRFYCDLSEAQAAAVLGCSRGTVKSQTARGLANLRSCLAGGIEGVE